MKAIVKNETYEVTHFDEDSELVGNLIFAEPTALIDWQSYEFESVLGIKVKYKKRKRLNKSGTSNSYKDIDISYKDTLLKSINGKMLGSRSKYKTATFFSIAEHLNYYNSLDKEELQVIAEKLQNETKTTLEEEIEDLKLQKSTLEEDLQTFIEIQQKREEINQLVKKLDR
jgi:hypothetical protein